MKEQLYLVRFYGRDNALVFAATVSAASYGDAWRAADALRPELAKKATVAAVLTRAPAPEAVM